MTQVELPIKNFQAQEEIFNNKSKYKIVVKGRRFGLTKGAANDFIKCALEGSFKQGLWVDTVNSNIDRYVERYFIPALRNLPKELRLWDWKQQKKTLYIKDAYIDFRSADRPENIEGFGYDKVFLNEAGIILKDEYLWENAIRPMLWEFSPPTVIGGTPKGAGGTFHNLAIKGQDPNEPDYAYFHFSTFDNPYLNAKEIEEEIKTMPELARRQEVYGEFLDDGGEVFRGVKDVMTAEPQKPESGHLYVMGVDLAKVQDFTVITVYDRQTNSQVYQDRFAEINWVFQKKRIAAISKHYNNALVILDATGLGDPICDDLIRDQVPVTPFKITNESKKEMIEKLSIYIEQKRIRMLDIEETFREFSIFTYDMSPSGRIRYNAPEGMHDDIVISHALAVSELFSQRKASDEKPSLIRSEMLRRAGIMEETDYYEPI